MTDVAVLEYEALKLPEAQRALLVDHLQASLTASQIVQLEDHLSESKSRFEAYQSGEIEAIDSDEVIAKLRAGLAK